MYDWACDVYLYPFGFCQKQCTHFSFLGGLIKLLIFKEEQLQNVPWIPFLSLLWLFFSATFLDSKPRLLWLAEYYAIFISKYHLHICVWVWRVFLKFHYNFLGKFTHIPKYKEQYNKLQYTSRFTNYHLIFSYLFSSMSHVLTGFSPPRHMRNM